MVNGEEEEEERERLDEFGEDEEEELKATTKSAKTNKTLKKVASKYTNQEQVIQEEQGENTAYGDTVRQHELNKLK